jgi:hypothetical protein
MKTLIGLVLGIIIAAAVIVPIFHSQTATEIEAQRAKSELEPVQAETDTLKAEQTAEQPEIIQPGEANGTDETAVAETAGLKTETEVKPDPQTTASPQATAKPAEPQYPKYFYENGKKYAYNTAYAEEMGYKTEIYEYAEDESSAVQEDDYDWENDPLGKVKGPFN